MQNLEFKGKISNNQLSGDFKISCSVLCPKPLKSAQTRTDRFGLSLGTKYELGVQENGSRMESLTVKSEASEGQFIATAEVCAYGYGYNNGETELGSPPAFGSRSNSSASGGVGAGAGAQAMPLGQPPLQALMSSLVRDCQRIDMFMFRELLLYIASRILYLVVHLEALIFFYRTLR